MNEYVVIFIMYEGLLILTIIVVLIYKITKYIKQKRKEVGKDNKK